MSGYASHTLSAQWDNGSTLYLCPGIMLSRLANSTVCPSLLISLVAVATPWCWAVGVSVSHLFSLLSPWWCLPLGCAPSELLSRSWLPLNCSCSQVPCFRCLGGRVSSKPSGSWPQLQCPPALCLPRHLSLWIMLKCRNDKINITYLCL